jgi:TolA-binding protein
MRRTRLAAALLALALVGCPGSGAGELLETAQLEEAQRNLPHARKLYEEILARYPDAPEAKTARERLAALGE